LRRKGNTFFYINQILKDKKGVFDYVDLKIQIVALFFARQEGRGKPGKPCPYLADAKIPSL
jgi:hypothetical protein